MFVYVGKSFSSVVTGSRIVRVTCEKCHADFFYELVRQGKGAASAPYYIGQARAAKRAEKAARKSLEKKLAREAEMVPCPRCRWINQSLIQGYRRTRYRRVGYAAVISGFALTVALLVADAASSRRYGLQDFWASLLWTALVGILVAAIPLGDSLVAAAPDQSEPELPQSAGRAGGHAKRSNGSRLARAGQAA